MKSRQDNSTEVAAAKASISRATAYRIESDPRLPSQKKQPSSRRRSDPLEHIFETEVVPLLKAAPGIRAVAVYGEMLRRHPIFPKASGEPWNGASGHGVQFTARSRRSSSARRMNLAVSVSPTSPI